MAQESAAPLREALRADTEAFVLSVEEMRKRLMDDAGVVLDEVVNHAFLRLVELLLIGAVLAGVGVVLGVHFLRR